MASIDALRTALVTTLEGNISGFKCYRMVPENALVVPCALIELDSTNFMVSMGRGTDTHQITLLVLVSYNHSEIAQTNLDPYVAGSGTRSIREVIWNNRDLGVSGWNATVTQMYDYGMRYVSTLQGHGHEQIGARLAMTVHTRGYS